MQGPEVKSQNRERKKKVPSMTKGKWDEKEMVE
jgi:hypothetical protein